MSFILFYHFLSAVSLGSRASKMYEHLDKIVITFYTKYINKIVWAIQLFWGVYLRLGVLIVYLFCCFTSQVYVALRPNSYGHGGTVSSPYHTFS